MAESSPLERSVNALTQYFIIGDTTMSDTLHRVSDAVTIAVPQAEFVGLTMTVEGKVGTFIFNHPEVREIDRGQYEAGRGPCLEAFRTGEPFIIDSTRRDTEWPEFSSIACAHGILSTMSIPMLLGGAPTGAMNLYATTEFAFGQPDVEVASVFAQQAGFVLVNAEAYWDAKSLGENLTIAMESRATIEQAKGIIMATQGGTPDEAFESLSDQSRHQNIRVRDVARQIVEDAARRGRPR